MKRNRTRPRRTRCQLITPHYRSISQLLQNRSFGIDEYQREYKWEQKHIEELLSDLLATFQSSHREGNGTTAASGYAEYFLGSIIVAMREDKAFLVDGQQRTTSLTLLLIHLYRLADEYGLRAKSALEPLIYSAPFGDLKFNLDIPERTPVLRALFAGEQYNGDGKEESVRTILDRYRDIEAFDLADSLGAGLEVFIYWLIQKVGLIEIVADDDTEAYSIFETMNDRGKPLSPVDMVKAFLLAPIQEESVRTAANDRWKRTVMDLISSGSDRDNERDSEAMKAWLRAQFAESTRERRGGSIDRDWELIGSAFHRWLRDNAQRVGVGTQARNVAVMTEEFPFFAGAYLAVLSASQAYTAGWEPVFHNAQKGFTWQNTVALAPLIATDDAETVRRKIVAVATYLDIWVMRRVVNYVRVGYSGVSYAMYLLVKEIRRKSLDELITVLKDRLAKDEATFDGYGKDRRGIDGLNLNQFTSRYIFHLLARITAHLEVSSGRPDHFDDYVNRKRKNPEDIEHITANDFSRFGNEFESEQDFASWRNGIGGLLLLPADVNRSLQDKSFADKMPHYAKQNLLAASLTPAAYQHQPQFLRYIRDRDLPFTAYKEFGRQQQDERKALIRLLCDEVWAPERLDDLLG